MSEAQIIFNKFHPEKYSNLSPYKIYTLLFIFMNETIIGDCITTTYNILNSKEFNDKFSNNLYFMVGNYYKDNKYHEHCLPCILEEKKYLIILDFSRNFHCILTKSFTRF